MSELDPAFESLLQSGLSSIRNHLPRVFGIYLFGSALQGALRSDSDVDLAVIGTRAIDPLTLAEEQARLESIFGRPVDLIDLVGTDPVLRAEAMLKGRLVFTSDSDRSILAELEAIRSLEEHTVWIEPIIRDILERNSTFRSSDS